MSDPLADADAIAARTGSSAWDLEVVDTIDLTPTMRRIRLAADGLGGLEYAAGQDLMLAMPSDGARPVHRRYTIRSLDRPSGVVDVDVVLHGDGPGANWAASAERGARIRAVGPRGKVFVDPDADWHFFIGDESFVPAAFAMIESLPSGARAGAILEVANRTEEQQLAGTFTAEAVLIWLYRGRRKVGDAAGLEKSVSGLDLATGRGHAYIGAELRVANAIGNLLVGKGLAAEQVSVKAYWRRGEANRANGEPSRR